MPRHPFGLLSIVGALALTSFVTSCHASRGYAREGRSIGPIDRPEPTAGRETPDRLRGEFAVGEARVREFRVTAKKQEFVPNRFELMTGEPVKFTVHSEDDLHTFSVKED